MFLAKQSPSPSPESNGLEFRLKLSEDTLAKLIPWAVSIIVGSGVAGVVHAQFDALSLDSSDSPAEQVTVNEEL